MSTNRLKTRPFCCEICRSTFTMKAPLKRHIISLKHYLGAKVPESLKSLLPDTVPYSVCDYNSLDDNNFAVRICVSDFRNVDELHKWITNLGTINNCVYVRKYSNEAKRITTQSLHEELYYCQHFRSTEKKVYKHKGTKCPSKIYIRMKREKTHFVTIIKITNNHNHSTKLCDFLRFTKPSKEVEDIFKFFFENGSTPMHALKNYKIHLSLQMNDSDYLIHATDRSLIPDINWVKHYFCKLFKEKSGSKKCEIVFAAVEKFFLEKSKEYDQKQQVCILKELNKDDFVISILTPVMRRISRLQSAGEVVFIDIVGSVGLFGLKAFLLVSETYVGGLPIGILVSTSEKTSAIAEGFNLFLSQIDDSCFGGRGKKGPLCIMTTDSPSKLAALKKVFPESYFFSGIFHFLQSAYRWLLNSANGISKSDKIVIYTALRKMLYASNLTLMKRYFDSLIMAYGDKYNHLRTYITKLYKKRQDWAISFRGNVALDGLNVNNMVERVIRTLREETFKRIKARSPVQLIDFIITEYDNFLKNELTECSLHSNNYDCFRSKQLTEEVVNEYEIRQSPQCESLYNVLNKAKSVVYLINLDIGSCTCFVGCNGNFCKHLQLLTNKVNFDCPLRYPEDPVKCAELLIIATGTNMDSVIFTPVIITLNDSDSNNEVQQYDVSFGHTMIPEITIETTSEQSNNLVTVNCKKEFAEVKKNFEFFINSLESDSHYYMPGLQSLNKELQKLPQLPAKDKLSALLSFNKNIDCNIKE